MYLQLRTAQAVGSDGYLPRTGSNRTPGGCNNSARAAGLVCHVNVVYNSRSYELEYFRVPDDASNVSNYCTAATRLRGGGGSSELLALSCKHKPWVVCYRNPFQKISERSILDGGCRTWSYLGVQKRQLVVIESIQAERRATARPLCV